MMDVELRPNRVGALRELAARLHVGQFEMIQEWLDAVGDAGAEALLIAATAAYERCHPSRFSSEPFVSDGAVSLVAHQILEEEWELVIPAMVAFAWMKEWDVTTPSPAGGMDRKEAMMASAINALRGFAEGMAVIDGARTADLSTELLGIVADVESAVGSSLFTASVQALGEFASRLSADEDKSLASSGTRLSQRYIRDVELAGLALMRNSC